MKTWRAGLGLWVLAALAGVSSAQAQEQEQEQERSFGLELGYEYSSLYVFRGVDLLEGEGTPTPRVIFTMGGFSGSYYGYYGDIGAGGPDLEEHDFSADYTFTRGKLDLTLGAVTYTYRKPEDFEDTTEAYAILSLNTLLTPTFTAAREFESGGSYLSLGIGHELPLWSERLTLGLGTALAYDLGYWSDEFELEQSRGWSDLLLRTNLTWNVAGPLSAYVALQHSIALDILDEAGQGDETFYTVGTMLEF